jgi:hypothetical protein
MSIPETKKCTKCSLEKPATLEFFNKHQRGKYGLHAACKDCRSKERVKWYEQNPDYNKSYYETNRKEIRSQQLNYAKKNRSQKHQYDQDRKPLRNAQAKERWRFDPIYRLRKIFRRRFSHFLSSNITANMEKYVGCTLDELKSHIESLWHDGMSWDNYGNPNGDHSDCWHIDHIIPVSSFDYENDLEQSLRDCWHYTNLQPLWAKDNLTKSFHLL